MQYLVVLSSVNKGNERVNLLDVVGVLSGFTLNQSAIGQAERHEFVWMVGDNPTEDFLNNFNEPHPSGGHTYRSTKSLLDAQANPPVSYSIPRGMDVDDEYQPYITYNDANGIITAYELVFDLSTMVEAKS